MLSGPPLQPGAGPYLYLSYVGGRRSGVWLDSICESVLLLVMDWSSWGSSNYTDIP